jgi:tRNA(Arg) A34 adenosine deaminase TadA
MKNPPLQLTIEMPRWVHAEQQKLPSHLTSIDQQMKAIMRFSRLNFQHNTGGPFAAGVFEKESGKLVAIGVNRVVPENVSSAHAEIIALSLAQQKLGTFDLGGPDMPHHRLVVNGRPCAMCFGSLPWSGVRSLVIGASGEQIETITGFDEGPIHPCWREELQNRGIEVIENVLADQACEIFREFAASGAAVYNGRSATDE